MYHVAKYIQSKNTISNSWISNYPKRTSGSNIRSPVTTQRAGPRLHKHSHLLWPKKGAMALPTAGKDCKGYRWVNYLIYTPHTSCVFFLNFIQESPMWVDPKCSSLQWVPIKKDHVHKSSLMQWRSCSGYWIKPSPHGRSWSQQMGMKCHQRLKPQKER